MGRRPRCEIHRPREINTVRDREFPMSGRIQKKKNEAISEVRSDRPELPLGQVT